MSQYVTRFGSLLDYQKGTIEIVDDDPRHYAFSNIFEVANNSKAYEKVAVGKNMDYVLEAIRAEGTSDWRTAAHDEFALVMDGQVEVRLIKLDQPLAPPDRRGSMRIDTSGANGRSGSDGPSGANGPSEDDREPKGQRMGRVVARRGHMVLLPANSAYQFHADAPSAVLLQTIAGDDTIYRWPEICTTA
jgi:hypothetical protein